MNSLRRNKPSLSRRVKVYCLPWQGASWKIRHLSLINSSSYNQACNMTSNSCDAHRQIIIHNDRPHLVFVRLAQKAKSQYSKRSIHCIMYRKPTRTPSTCFHPGLQSILSRLQKITNHLQNDITRKRVLNRASNHHKALMRNTLNTHDLHRFTT